MVLAALGIAFVVLVLLNIALARISGDYNHKKEAEEFKKSLLSSSESEVEP